MDLEEHHIKQEVTWCEEDEDCDATEISRDEELLCPTLERRGSIPRKAKTIR